MPLLVEPSLGHYPEFRSFLATAFELDTPGPGEPGLLNVDDRFYKLVFVGRSGQQFLAGVEINTLVHGLEPIDKAAADLDVWAILKWLVAGVGGEWGTDALATTGEIYHIPAVRLRPPDPVAGRSMKGPGDDVRAHGEPVARGDPGAAASRCDAPMMARLRC